MTLQGNTSLRANRIAQDTTRLGTVKRSLGRRPDAYATAADTGLPGGVGHAIVPAARNGPRAVGTEPSVELSQCDVAAESRQG